jgi:DNA-binding MarR family transcriptional regulator
MTREEHIMREDGTMARASGGEAQGQPCPTSGGPRDEETHAQIGELVGHLARRLRRSSARRLELLGLTYGQARALRLIARAGSPLRMSEIARRIEVVPRSATTVVAGLEGKGLVRRDSDKKDRRSVLVCLTGAGEQLLVEVGRDRDTAADELFGRLSQQDRAQLFRLLSAVAAAEEAAPDGADGAGTSGALPEGLPAR